MTWNNNADYGTRDCTAKKQHVDRHASQHSDDPYVHKGAIHPTTYHRPISPSAQNHHYAISRSNASISHVAKPTVLSEMP